ncbi:MAG: carbon-nitrogen hydrolase family protein, partial [Corynebacterium sp.]|nr:carbon-nitrogen hydrolase family protein [Corynebacterium sp.]
MPIKVASVAANFTRDLEQNFTLIGDILDEARDAGCDLVVFPEASVGGYLSSLGNHGDTLKDTNRSMPAAIPLDGPEIARRQELAGDTVVAIGVG